jgi:hypothetical protein
LPCAHGGEGSGLVEDEQVVVGVERRKQE